MDDLERLHRFKARADELSNTRLFRGGLRSRLAVRWNTMEGLRLESWEPDEEDLRSFLMTFRQFVLKKEPVYLFRIYNICLKRLTSDHFKSELIKSREAWKQMLKGRGICLAFNDQEIKPEDVYDWWINGHYFHSDFEKLQKLKRLLPPADIFGRYLFLDFLVEGTKVVIHVRNLLTVSLKDGLVSAQ